MGSSIRILIAICCLAGTSCSKETTEKAPAPVVSEEGKPPLRSTPPAPDPGRQFLVSEVPEDMVPVNAVLEDKVELLGYTLLNDSVAPGGTVQIVWYWRCRQPLGDGWRTFTHIHDEDGFQKGGQNDASPARRSFGPSSWRANQIIRDREQVRIPENWTSGTAEIRTGLWLGARRLHIKKGPSDNEDRIPGPRIHVSVGGVVKLPSPGATSVDVPYAEIRPAIDGQIKGDAAWENALRLSPFVDTLTGSKTRGSTTVQLMWDKTHLHVAMEASDVSLISQFTEPDPQLWREDAFVILLSPSLESYYEIQISPANVIYDAHLPEYRTPDSGWVSNGTIEVVCHGGLNDKETDEGWSMEMSIPFKSMSHAGGSPPAGGDSWRANFFRTDKSENDIAYTGWSPPMRGDFHALDRFGTIRFKAEEKQDTFKKSE